MIERRCTMCNTWNGDEARCISCGNPLSAEEILKVEEAKRVEWSAAQPKSKLDILYDKARNSKSFVVRGIFWIVFSVAFIVFGISSFVAYLVAWTPA